MSLTRRTKGEPRRRTLTTHASSYGNKLPAIEGVRKPVPKSGLLTLHRGGERFADLGGLDNLKGFCLRSLRQQGQSDSRRRPKGVLLLSPPGCGKSQFCKALGNEVGRPTLILDVGSLMGSLVGQTEANIRQALKIADAMSPCILMCDEVEKALSGVGSSGATDSGVSARLFGTLLTWLNDRTSDVYVVCTCNDISKLPPEFSRAERFDGVFFVELPGVQQRRAIWNLYVEQYGLDAHQPKPVDADWTARKSSPAAAWRPCWTCRWWTPLKTLSRLLGQRQRP